MHLLFVPIVAILLALAPSFAAADMPATFTAAKTVARLAIYGDQNGSAEGTLYCGCKWQWTGATGGRVEFAACSYQVRKQPARATRIEWEHIVPAWVMGHQRQCWQHGGRKNCRAMDPLFVRMESDLHNLAPVIGEVNADRANYLYGMAGTGSQSYGACTSRVNFKSRTFEPRDAVKGMVARVTFYMYDRYGMSMSRQQQRVLAAWDRQYPVSAWERERDRRIAAATGWHNPFVTGERRWAAEHRPLRSGFERTPGVAPVMQPPATAAVLGNRRSRIYHLPAGCPSYNRVSPKNQVPFVSERAAQAAGYRKARNCSR